MFQRIVSENSNGEFNVSFGRYSNPDWIQEQRIRKASRVLQDTAVFNTDFSYVVDEASSGDLVYFDPRTNRCRKPRISIHIRRADLTERTNADVVMS